MMNKINIDSNRQKLIIYVVLTVITLAVYWQVNQFFFINVDDNVYVTGNIHLQSGLTLSGVRWAFSTLYAEFWHPLTWLSLMLDYQLFGLNAGGYHLTNLILHIFTTLLLFRLFNRMTGEIWKSAFVAALFALHPLHVESVAWIAERKDVLSAFFWMLTLCLYVHYTEKPDAKRYLPVLLSFACALMSKSMAVTLPVVMILLDYWPLKRFQLLNGDKILWQLKEKTPLFMFSAVSSIVSLSVQQNPVLENTPLSLVSRVTNAPISFMIYLKNTFWPNNLAAFYNFPDQSPSWQILGAALLILIISVVVITARKRLPYLFIGWFWYVITLMPVIGIIQIAKAGNRAIADRFTYLPSIGVGIMLAWGIPLLFKHENARKKILFPAGVIIPAIMAVLTWQQCGYWKNGITLVNHTLQVTQNNYPAYVIKANAYFSFGGYQNAFEVFNEAIRLKPDFIPVYIERGNQYAELGQYQLAVKDFNEAIRLKPDSIIAHNNRGNVYAELGLYQPAIEDFSRAIRLKPDYADTYYNRGVTYAKTGHYHQAIEDYNQALCLKRDYADAFNGRGAVYLTQGNKISGCRDAQKACELGNCGTLELARGMGDCR